MAGRVDIFITTKVIIVTHAALPDRGKYVLSSNHFGVRPNGSFPEISQQCNFTVSSRAGQQRMDIWRTRELSLIDANVILGSCTKSSSLRVTEKERKRQNLKR